MLKTSGRQYPTLSPLEINYRPLSIVCVHFSDDIVHNFRKSQCVSDPLNQVIEVDNRNDAHFTNLGEAMNAGIRQAIHPTIAIAHEDLLFPHYWQQHFEKALRELEIQDPSWGILGIAGRNAEGKFEGHVSDPRSYRNTLAERAFVPVNWLDEQLLILQKDDPVLPDPDLPSIHNIGRDVARTASQKSRLVYVINAPCVHKYADAEGRIIQVRQDSPKIVDRRRFAYKAESACSTEYYNYKWGLEAETDGGEPDLSPRLAEILARPVIFVARGGGGSRLLSSIAKAIGIFLGNDLNPAGDCLEMVMPIYMGVIRKYKCNASWQKERTVPNLRRAAIDMLQKAGWPRAWGFKLPEAMYLIDELREAFPEAKFVHLVRDPLATCLRRTHMTGRLDNQVGRAVIPAGYDYAGRARALIHSDSPAVRMAVTTCHQLDMALSSLPADATYTIRFEDILRDAGAVGKVLAGWLNMAPPGEQIAKVADPARAAHPAVKYPSEVEDQVRGMLQPIRVRLEYS
jgi:hypothetical protein